MSPHGADVLSRHARGAAAAARAIGQGTLGTTSACPLRPFALPTIADSSGAAFRLTAALAVRPGALPARFFPQAAASAEKGLIGSFVRADFVPEPAAITHRA